MKNALFTLTIALLTSTLFAQSNKEEVDMAQSIFGMEKKAVVAELIQLDGAKGETFWALYDEYESKRKELGLHRLALLNAYADTYGTTSDATNDEILKEMISLKAGTDNLITTYTKKIQKKVDVKTAAQFFQVEGYILSKIRTRIMENVPLIGELDGM